MTLWMAVTLDELELPVCVEDSANKLAMKIGINRSSIYKSKDGTIQTRKIKIYELEVDE